MNNLERIESLKDQIDFQWSEGNNKVADLLCNELSEELNKMLGWGEEE